MKRLYLALTTGLETLATFNPSILNDFKTKYPDAKTSDFDVTDYDLKENDIILLVYTIYKHGGISEPTFILGFHEFYPNMQGHRNRFKVVEITA